MKTQASTTLTRGGRAFRLGAALLLVLLPLVSASARVRHNDAWARQQFAKAERMREALNGRPVGERTRREYQHVIDSYRRVYFGSPASSKADPSVVATAELMVEMGRRFDDNKILRGAVDEYRFLRKEYPGSKYRFDALFTIGEIYKDDLNDPEEARTTFQDFLHRYPRNRLADDARSAVKEIDAEADEMEHAAQKAAHKPRSNANASASDDDAESANAASVRRSALPRVTGVRHWSTPDYTRVAIDVEREVKFGSQRISHPDRIFFDLRDTKLASTLVGKTFDVDDGFLKKIRVAEFQPGRTRIVLEVDDLASYEAFLLPDPYRLIIDVHGKQNRAALVAKASDGKVRPAPDTSTSASAESDDNAGEPADSSNADVKPTERKAQPQSDKDVVGFTKPAPVETDLPAEDASADSKPPDSAKPANGVGVIKTTVAVKGSNRRIPKTIVEAEDRAPTKVATLEHEKIRPEETPRDVDNVSGADETKLAKSDLPSSSKSPSSLRRKKSRSAATAPDTADLHPETREARPTAAGDRSLIRALGLKIGKIVIDAGHGGHDTGTIGPNGLLEKDLVLDVAKRLGRLLESRLGAEVIYTRQDDTFIPLETRTAVANRERADLFISIHANSSRDSDARGVETYYLNFTSSPEALEVAARENAVSEKSIHELQDLVKKIALKEKIEESREFAGDVQESLYGGLALNNAGIRNRGIKKAPFIVLIGANMPSILAEISFVSNPTDERKLETSEHRQRIAESLYRGVSKYVSGLSGVKVASKLDKHEGQ
ncbi:MAG: N-acetylmuramoyl-L-alanine amidase [Acidobacteriia bacterium]|nr:N-acetylmuramoyl-L-alanine amidase [Terriglobia bacterium]